MPLVYDDDCSQNNVDIENDIEESFGHSFATADKLAKVFTVWRQIEIVWSQQGVIRQFLWQEVFCIFAIVLPQSNLVAGV